MGRYSAGTRSTGAGSTTLPVGSLYGAAAVAGKIVEIGVWNTTSTAVAIKLARLTTAGTQGTGLTEAPHNKLNQVAASLTAVDTHTGSAPSLGDDLGYRATLAGAVGAGAVFTFGGEGLWVPIGTANGVGIIVATGTGQILDWYVVWDE